MPEFSTRLRLYSQISDARCILCGAVYQKLFVGVVLFKGDQPLGSVCGRCLSEPPGRCAQEARERADRLWDQAGEAAWDSALRQETCDPLHAQVMTEHAARERAESRRAEGRAAREAARGEGMAWPGPARPESLLATVEEKEDRAVLLDSLADGIELFSEWPTSLESLRDTELVAMQEQFPEFAHADVRAFFEERYGQLIARRVRASSSPASAPCGPSAATAPDAQSAGDLDGVVPGAD